MNLAKTMFPTAYQAAVEQEPLIVEGDVRIIYEHDKPHGIRDDNGFLLFFPPVTKYDGQEERYRQETEQQFRLADHLLNALRG